jgi:hypothetical protein
MTDYTQDVTENLILTDVSSKIWTLARTYSDNLKESDGDTEITSKLLTDSLKLSSNLFKVLARTYSDTLDLTDIKKFSIIKKVSSSLKLSDDDNTCKYIGLTENIKLVNNPPICPVNLLNTTLSNKQKWVIYSGTYQQIINNLDLQGIPENKVKGFAFVSAGRGIVLVNKH